MPIVEALRAAGHDVTAVGDVAPGVADEEVLKLANGESRVLLTNDKDFVELVYREGRAAEGILLLRLGAEDSAEKAAHVTCVLPTIAQRVPGHFAVVSEDRVRLRLLRRS